jgi:hypothetical protein
MHRLINTNIMTNTVLKNIISNFDLMAKDHFLDWFEENKEVLLQKEKDQIIEANEKGLSFMGFQTADFKYGSKYYNNIFGNL